MGIRDIHSTLEKTANSAPVQGSTEKLIIHFENIDKVDETKFQHFDDPIVVYRSKGKNEIVSVLPFKEGEEAKSSLPFKEKLQYFRQRVLDSYTGEELESVLADETVTTLLTTDYGTFEEFQTALANPVLIGLSLEELFNGLYLDLNIESLTEFQVGISSALA